MKCEKCGGEWIPPKDISVSLMNCPFCGTPILSAEKAGGYTDMGEFLAYLVSLYGAELYKSCQKLNNLIADLYQGDERLKRAYRRAIMDDTLAQRIYELSLKPLNEREAYRNQIDAQFSDANFYSSDFGKQIVDSFTSGLRMEILPPIISTVATEEDGEWVDEYGVVYSADRKKLIRGKDLTNYMVKEGTVAVCDGAFAANCFKYFSDRGNFCTFEAPGPQPDFWEWKPDYFGGNHYDCYTTKILNISIPNTVLCLGKKAFAICVYLREIKMPNSILSIGEGCFVNCKSLTKIAIPNSVTSIEDCTFKGCHSLTDIIIPNSVTSIGEDAFRDCGALTNITIPSSVTSIGKAAFYDCKSLTIITIPNSVTSIGMCAFYGCESLTSIVIPDSVKSIENDVFFACKSLTSITIPNSVTSIGWAAFYYCI